MVFCVLDFARHQLKMLSTYCCSTNCKKSESCNCSLNHPDPNLFDRSQVWCIMWNSINFHISFYIFSTLPFVAYWYIKNITFVMQWCPEGRVSNWYPIYRVVVALLFMGSVIGDVVDDAISGNVNAGKWFIFMTNISFLFLAIHYVIDAYLTVSRWTWEHFNEGDACKSHFFQKRCVPNALNLFGYSV